MSRVLKNYPNKVTNKYAGVHSGIDIVGKDSNGKSKLDYVVAHSDGVVVAVVDNYKTNDKTGNSYGNYVKIKHDNGYYTLYAHLKYGSVKVSVGDRVKKGEVIGYIGNTGYANGAHLHFEVRNKSDSRIDPTPYINADLPNMVTKKVEYRVYDNKDKKYLPKVIDGKPAGKSGNTIGGIQAYTYGFGSTRLIASTIESGWLPEVKDGGFGSKNSEYAGIKGERIDRFMFKSEKGKYRYRAKLLNGAILPWVSGYNKKDAKNGYAGITGKPIEWIEIEFT